MLVKVAIRPWDRSIGSRRIYESAREDMPGPVVFCSMEATIGMDVDDRGIC